MKVIVGLGNPGREYARTPHNAGFMALDVLAGRVDAHFHRGLFSKVETARAAHEGEPLVLVKPQTYMNLSGPAVASVLSRRGATAADLIVVVDDADLTMGQLRIRAKGSAGGHKGLRSIIERLGGEDFTRIRIGVGRGGGNADLTRHVLRPMQGEEWNVLQQAAEKAAEAVLWILEHGADSAMTRYNTRGSEASRAQDQG